MNMSTTAYDTIVAVRKQLTKIEEGMRGGKLQPEMRKRALRVVMHKLAQAAGVAVGDTDSPEPDIVSESQYQVDDLLDFSDKHQQYWTCSAETLRRLRRVTDGMGVSLIQSPSNHANHDAALLGRPLHLDEGAEGLMLCGGDGPLATFEPPCQCRRVQVKVNFPSGHRVHCADCDRDMTEEVDISILRS